VDGQSETVEARGTALPRKRCAPLPLVGIVA
jgi:hypothetical protein